MFAAVDPLPAQRWEARLELGFAASNGRTALVRRSHFGPLQVQRPFYPEGPAPCHVYLLHPPGGIVGGDRLAIDVTAYAGARALLTTPAATKFYRSAGPTAEQHASIRVEAGASVEWLPQETIVFGGARAESSVEVDISGDGSFLGWEIAVLGRPAAGDHFEHGEYVQKLSIRVDGKPVAVERARYDGASGTVHRRIALGGFPVTGTFLAVTRNTELAAKVREALPPSTDVDLFSVTGRRQVLVCRYLGGSAERARMGFAQAWAVIRPALLGRESHAPRIWAT